MAAARVVVVATVVAMVAAKDVVMVVTEMEMGVAMDVVKVVAMAERVVEKDGVDKCIRLPTFSRTHRTTACMWR